MAEGPNPLEIVIEEMGRLLDATVEQLDADVSLVEQGLSSSLAVELMEVLNERLNLDLGIEAVFDVDSPAELASAFAGALAARGDPDGSEPLGDESVPEQGLSAIPNAQDSSAEGIAIIGMAARFADLHTSHEIWEASRDGVSRIREVVRDGWSPADYYDMDPAAPNKSVSKWGGFLDRIDEFDPLFFRISPREAKRMDPQQRIFLQEAYHAVEDAGYAPEELSGRRVGVFVGARASDYQEQVAAAEDIGSHLFLGTDMSILAGRVSHFFNVTGPSLAVDTACSSALVALHLACESVRRGESEIAIAGGVFLATSPRFFVLASKIDMLSPAGRVRSFAPEADGMVVGEGAGALLLKPLSAALQDGDHIHGVIRGSATGHNGRTHAVTTPATHQVTSMVADLYHRCGVPPETVGYLEVQGAGIRLGDSVELSALTKAFDPAGERTGTCALSSHKPILGHAINAAGIAAVVRVLLAMRHRQIPPILSEGAETELAGTPFFMTPQPRRWTAPSDQPLRAGINSFGFGGTNCHIVLEEAPAAPRATAPPPILLLPISASKPDALRRRLTDLLHWAEREGSAHNPADVAYTLQVGRSHLPVRAALLVSDVTELTAALRAIEDGQDPACFMMSDGATIGSRGNGVVEPPPAGLGTLGADELWTLAEAYVRGVDIAWRELYSDATRSRRVPLPTYPFATDRYWAGGVALSRPVPASAVSTAEAAVHTEGATSPSCLLVPTDDMPRLDEAALAEHYRIHDELRRWAHDSMLRVFTDEQALAAPDQRTSLAAVKARLGVIERHDRQLAALLEMLNRSGAIEIVGDELLVTRPVPTHAELAAERARLNTEYREARPFTLLLATCFEHYPQVLRGELLANEVLFPRSSMTLIEHLYRGHNLADLCNDLMAWSLTRYLEYRVPRLSPGQRINIVEVGAGTGGTSQQLFAAIRTYGAHLRYCYTDVSLALTKYGAREFGTANPYAEFLPLDVERNVTAQGFRAGEFDVLVATNVLHATRQVEQVMANLGVLLGPQGWLMLNELTTVVDVISMIVGQLDGWWLHEDRHLRLPHSPVLTAQSWRGVLQRSGFRDIVLLGPQAQRDRGVGQNVFIAEYPGPLGPNTSPLEATRGGATEVRPEPVAALVLPAARAASALHAAVKERILDCVAAAVELDRSAIDRNRPFSEYGVDSVLAVDLVDEINRVLGTAMRTSVLFDHVSIEDLADHVVRAYPEALTGRLEAPAEAIPGHDAVTVAEPPSPPMAPTAVVTERLGGERAHALNDRGRGRDVAVIGLSCRLPGAANAWEYWDNLLHGRIGVTEVPSHRWDVERFYDPSPDRIDTTYCRHGGFLDDVECFDPLFFGMTGRDAAVSDPQHRLFLQEAWKALEDAGYATKTTGVGRCGVFVGTTGGDYDALQEDRGVAPTATTLLNNHSSTLTGRISYFLDLKGPNLAVDTACSSSLVAIHLATRSLIAGESDLALAGGVFVATTQRFFIHMSRLGVLSPAGACRPFDAAADGFVPGEGVGALVLKPLAAAQRDGDHIYGVIKSTAVNHDGRTNGFTAPSTRSQTALAEQLYAQAGVNPETIGYIEAHGTATSLGDPIEIEALTAAYRRYTDRRQFCRIGSVKANIGHCVGAAGVAGVIKVLLGMRHGTIPPMPNFNRPNELIDFTSSPFCVNTEPEPWPTQPGHPRRAMVSAFGMSGTNAQVLVEEAPAPDPVVVPESATEELVVLSAPDDDGLRRYAAALAAHLCGPEVGRVRLADVAHTLRTRRTTFAERFAVRATGVEQLAERLRRFAEGQAGVDVDWSALPNTGRGQPIPLPTYPFRKERYWLADPEVADPQPRMTPPSTAEPTAAVHYFTTGWRPVPPSAQGRADGRILVVGDRAERAVAAALLDGPVIDADPEADLPRMLTDLMRSGAQVDGVLCVLPPTDPGPNGMSTEGALVRTVYPVLHLVRAATAFTGPIRVMVVCGRPVGASQDPFSAALGALGRGLPLAAANLSYTFLEVVGETSPAGLVRAALAEWGARDEPEIRLDDGQRLAPSLREITPGSPDVAPWRCGGTVLITGGAGGLGRLVARYLAQRYSSRLVLTGRTPSGSAVEQELARLAALGAADAVYRAVDVADHRAMTALVAEVRQRYGAIHAVIHTAGVLDQRNLQDKDWGAIEATLRPKVSGSVVLDAVTAQEPLDLFVIFSSAASVMGDFGEGDYAVANRFADVFTARREELRAKGTRSGRTVALNWGLWEDGGMQMKETSRRLYSGVAGLGSMTATEGLAAFDQVLAAEWSHALVVPGTVEGIEWLHRRFGGTPSSPSWDGEAASAARPSTARLNTEPGAVGEPRPVTPGSPESEVLRERLLIRLRAVAAQALQVEGTRLSLDEGLAAFGFDSLGLKYLATQLGRAFGIAVSPTVFFSRGTLRDVAEFLLREHPEAVRAGCGSEAEGRTPEAMPLALPHPAPALESRAAPPSAGSLTQQPQPPALPVIAVVGMAGVLPGSRNLREFWAHVVAGDDLVREVPPERWDWRAVYSPARYAEGRTRSRWGGFTPQVDGFDARFFGISSREAQLMDPQQRLFLQAAWAAVEDAGWRATALAGRRIGVYVGAQYSDYRELLYRAGATYAQVGTGCELPMMANRVSYLFDLSGPSEVVNTACSSSLVAVHRAITAIRRGECEAAIVGASSLMLTPTYSIVTSQMGVISPTGRCRTFDRHADGYVRGEGVLAVVLKPLHAALRDDDHVYAVIRGSAVNHGGRASSLTAPNADAQAELIVAAWDDAGVPPTSVSYVEAHGVGTELGDPVEVEGLRGAVDRWSQRTSRPVPATAWCGLGTVKTQMGHLEPASGLAGLVKVVLSLRHQMLPGLMHLSEANPLLNLEGSPFYLVDSTRPWETPLGVPRTAGVSSFGFGGANAHAIVQEHPTPRRGGDEAPTPQLMVVSARTEQRLRAYAASLAEFLRDRDATGDRPALADIAFTLQVGREPMAERLALIGDDADALAHDLAAYAAGDQRAGLYRGTVPSERRSPDPPPEPTDLATLARFWIAGGEPDWPAVHAARGDAPRRVPVPTYPFAEDRYWYPFPDQPAPATRADTTVTAQLHPLVEASCSTPSQQRFRTKLRGDEFFLTDHVVAGHPTLPGVCYLEMARFAAATAGADTIPNLRDVRWIRPIVVGRDPVVVHITVERGDQTGMLRIRFETGDDASSPVVHATVTTVTAAGPDESEEPINVAAITARARQRISAATWYRRVENDGVRHGPAFRVVEEVWCGPAESLARLALPKALHAGADDFTLHPALMDGVLQAVMGLLDERDPSEGPLVPFTVGEVRTLDRIPRTGYAYATPAPATSATTHPVRRFDVRLAGDDGHVAVVIKDVVVRPMPATGIAAAEPDGVPTTYWTAEWERAELGPLDRSIGPVLLMVDDVSEAVDAIAADTALGHPVIEVHPGDHFREVRPGQRYLVRPDAPADYELVLETLRNLDLLPDAIVHGWAQGVSEPTPDDAGVATSPAFARGLLSLFLLCKALAKQRHHARLLTVVPSSVPSATAVTGFARVVRLEHPGLALAVAECAVPLSAAQMRAELTAGSDEPEVRYGDHPVTRWARRWRELSPSTSTPDWVRPDGVYLITGGGKGLGRLVAEHLVRNGAGTLILAGRSELDEADRRSVADLAAFPPRLGGQASPATVEYHRVDVSRRDQVSELVGEVRRRFGAIHGVVHCAMVLRDGLLFGKPAAHLAQVCAPKVDGVRWLDEATADLPLDVFVLFSSLSGVVGNIGQSDYAYANRYLDDFAVCREELRRMGRRHGCTVSIAWPLWADGGQKMDHAAARRLSQSTGMRPLPTDVGLTALDTACALGVPNVAVWHGPPRGLRRMLGHAPVPESADTRVVSESAPSLSTGVAAVRSTLTQLCAGVLEVDPADLDVGEELRNYGLDSILMMSLLSRIEAQFGIVVEPSALAEHPTIAEAAEYLAGKGVRVLADPAVSAAASAPESLPEATFSPLGPWPARVLGTARPWRDDGSGTAPIAVVGMVGRFPGSPSIEEFWENLVEGRHLVSEIPADRWRITQFFDPDPSTPNKSYSKWGGFIDGVYDFDAAYFQIDPEDALVTDPHHRIVLELTAQLLAAAGYRQEELAETRTGVYIAGGDSNYVPKDVSRIPPESVRHLLVGTIPNMMAARVSDFFDLRGPSQTVDTACSASLVAVHQACRALRSGECDVAIAGGVEILADAFVHVAFSKAGVLSPEGMTAVFDQHANGFVIGEGAGLVLLKRLGAAITAEDRILGVISGSAVNNDGRTMGPTVPSMAGQEEVIAAALADAEVDPVSVGYLEAHGTGTLLGDPIEVGAATRVFLRGGVESRQWCGIGSVKSNVGHLGRAAGMPSLVKALLAVQRGVIPATLHCRTPHPRFRFEDSPFVPVTITRTWRPAHGAPRRAGVSAFGFGGTNAHVIVEQYQPPATAPVGRAPLPPPIFHRRRYRLGHSITDTPAQPALMDLINAVHCGDLDPERAAAMVLGEGC